MNRKLIYSILKELSVGKIPKAVDYEIEEIVFMNVVKSLIDEGLIANAKAFTDITGKHIVKLEQSRITLKGLDYLEDNSEFAKTYALFKELWDWIK